MRGKKTMKKQAYKLLPILLSTTLVVSCGVQSRSSSSDGNNYGDISDSGVTSSDIPSSSSIDDGEQGELDKIIADFVSDLDVVVPSVNEYDLFYEVYYYYSYQQYVISAANNDTNNFESDYLAKFTSDTGLVSLNDDSYYTVEDYGYMFGDDANNPNLTITFYTEEGVFYLTITRADGLYGTLEVSDVDTNWYVDYVNFNNFILSEEFPETDINVTLETDLEIPSITADVYPYAVIAPYEDENGSYPLTYYVIFEGDQVQAYATLLQSKGYEVNLIENTGETINWDTYEVEEYTYYTGTAYDPSYRLYISIQEDESGNTVIMFNNFNDVASKDKTSNTDWTNEEKELMNSTLHQVLPFMAFGEDYELYDDSDEEWNLLVLEDTYYEDLSADYIALLKNAGFKEDSTSYTSTCYYFDNGLSYIEVFIDYDGGHYLEIYYDPSKLPPLTCINLNEYELDIVAGASYQLNASFVPSNAAQPVTWSSNNNDVIAVDQTGKVTIKENAEVGQTAIITVSSLGGISNTCTVTVAANVVTRVKIAQDYNVAPGGTVKVDYYLLPIGATTSETVNFEIDGDYASIDQNGNVTISEDAEIGVKYKVTVRLGSSDIKDDALVTVVEPEITHTLNQSFFGLKQGESSYKTYTKTTDEDAYYEAQCAATHGIQIRSKNNDSGIIAHFIGRSCASITFTFDANTYSERTVNIYGSNTDFCISDMYDSTAPKVGSVTYTQGGETTFTYTFTDDYSYIGFRSDNSAIFFTSIEVVWR